MTVLVILILSLVTSIYHETRAAPSQLTVYSQTSVEPTLPYGTLDIVLRNASTPSLSQCSCPNTRTLIDILWSCITTVLICTWVSVHPNLPPEGEKRWRALLRRIKVMFWGLITPELILGWSARQWVTARKIAKENSHRGWSQVHGFLFVMGGFSLMKGDEDLGTLSYAVFSDLLRAGDIDFPVILLEDINEKSKGDPLSKALVVLQTTWFIVQCIARAVLGLAITELEIVTLAFCSLNAVTYFFWWYKPLDIQRRVPIYLKAGSNYRPTNATAQTHEDTTVQGPVKENVEDQRENSAIGELETEHAALPTFRRRLIQPINKRVSFIKHAIVGYFFRLRNAFREDLANFNIIYLFLFLYPIVRPILLLLLLLTRILAFIFKIIASIMGNSESEHIQPGAKRVNTFYTPKLHYNDDVKTCALYTIVGYVFGALHCIAWDFHFPTPVERSLWRSMSLIITFIPICFISISLTSYSEDEDGVYRSKVQNKFLRGLESIFLSCIAILVGLYIPCRLILLIQSFISLRNVPPSVYLAFSWQNYIPHL